MKRRNFFGHATGVTIGAAGLISCGRGSFHNLGYGNAGSGTLPETILGAATQTPAESTAGGSAQSVGQVQLTCQSTLASALNRENPGEWSTKIDGHVPKVESLMYVLKVSTAHEMTAEHHISRHMVLDADGQVLAERTLDPVADLKAESLFVVPLPKTSTFHVISVCNKHETWKETFETAAFAKSFIGSNTVFSAESPGPWAAKVSGHQPTAEVFNGLLSVSTAHGMAPEHFISRHQVLDGHGQVLAERVFDLSVEATPQSLFALPRPTTDVFYVASSCNQHGTWITLYRTSDFLPAFSMGTQIYASGRAGKWAGKEAGHTPVAELLPNGDLGITVNHVMTPEHHISRIQVRSGNGAIIADQMLDPAVDTAAALTVSRQVLTAGDTVVILAECNLHDVWLSSLTLA